MATGTITTATAVPLTKEPLNHHHHRPRFVCFSYAVYAKSLIDHLKSTTIVPVHDGLTDSEINTIESALSFTFPPDLRSILQEGMPVGYGFPNWRSSAQQLRILFDLPRLCLLKEITDHSFWSDSWCNKPSSSIDARAVVQDLLDRAPTLVPIYRDCYIASAPNMAGNPVFYINEGEINILSFDITGFFRDTEFTKGTGFNSEKVNMSRINLPAWAATSPRKIEFWSDLAEHGTRRGSPHGATCGCWWDAGGRMSGCEGKLGSVLEAAFQRLRDGGWREEEVREMMDMSDKNKSSSGRTLKVVPAAEGRDGVEWQVRALSMDLLRAGWSKEDVVELLGIKDDDVNGLSNEESWLDYQRPSRASSTDRDDGNGDDKIMNASNKTHLQPHYNPINLVRRRN